MGGFICSICNCNIDDLARHIKEEHGLSRFQCRHEIENPSDYEEQLINIKGKGHVLCWREHHSDAWMPITPQDMSARLIEAEATLDFILECIIREVPEKGGVVRGMERISHSFIGEPHPEQPHLPADIGLVIHDRSGRIAGAGIYRLASGSQNSQIEDAKGEGDV
jgi:hypothetical protein